MTVLEKLDPRALVRDWQGPIYRYLLLRLRHEADAADVTQETFIRALERLDQLRDPDRLRPWLYQIAHNAAARHRRSQGRRRAHEAAGARDLPQAPEAELERVDEGRWIRRQVSELPPGLREPLALHYLQGLTQHEVAEALGMPRSTVQSRLNKGLEQLKSLCGARALIPLLRLGADAPGAPLPAELARALSRLPLNAAPLITGAIAMKIKLAACGAVLILIGFAAGVSLDELTTPGEARPGPQPPSSAARRLKARIAALEAERDALIARADRPAPSRPAEPLGQETEPREDRAETAAKTGATKTASQEAPPEQDYNKSFHRLLQLYADQRPRKRVTIGSEEPKRTKPELRAQAVEINALAARVLADPQRFARAALEVIEGPASRRRSALIKLVRGSHRFLPAEDHQRIVEAILGQLQSGGIAAEDHAMALRILSRSSDEALEKRSLAVVAAFLSDSDPEVLSATASHLARTGRAEAYEALAAAFLDPGRPQAAETILKTLNGSSRPTTEPGLLRMATHREPALRRQILEKFSYAQSLTPETIEALSQRFHSEPDPEARAIIVEALVRHGGPELAPILEHAAGQAADPQEKKALESAAQRLRRKTPKSG